MKSNYVLSTEMTPPSVNKLPNPRTRVVSATLDVRRGLFEDTTHHGQSGQIIKDLPIGSVVPSALSTDRTTVKAPLASPDLENLSASSQIIDRLESASGKLQALTAGKTVVETHLERSCGRETYSCTY